MSQRPCGRRAYWRDKVGDLCFNQVYGHNLIYNTSWEDPRLDRVALDLGPEDTLLTITSAGCNVLDYALLGPKHIYAVDMNYRQNALLELKLAGIRKLEFDLFFAMFGRGCLDNYRTVYQTQLRPLLSPVAQHYWDRHMVYFAGTGWRHTFYFHGTSGFFARLMNVYIDHVARVRDGINALFDVRSAAYPVPGPMDIITDTQAGAMHDDLLRAVQDALRNGRAAVCRELAGRYTWEKATEQFLQAVLPVVQSVSLDTPSHDANAISRSRHTTPATTRS